MTDANTGLLLTELRKAVRLEAGDYVVLLEERHTPEDVWVRLHEVAEQLWAQNIRLHIAIVHNLDAVRFVRVETPETIQVEET